MTTQHNYDVAIIGAGPSGTVAAALLRKKGYSVVVLERQYFPRFSIGESLLSQSTVFLEEADLLDIVKHGNFQFKDGAVFNYCERRADFDFNAKSSAGPAETFQVQRDRFDALLADEIVKRGACVWYGTQVTAVHFDEDGATLSYSKDTGESGEVKARFCLDASGFGRVLPRLLKLDKASDFPVRKSFFVHVEDNITDSSFNRNRILITIHPEYRDIWYWLIPFPNGTASVGVVAESKYFEAHDIKDKAALLKHYLDDDPYLRKILAQAKFITPAQAIEGYTTSVSSLYGKHFALLGNAGEFLDPVFSSGVTIAMKSASLAANILDRQFRGEAVEWEADYAEELMYGVNSFKDFVEAWYSGDLADIFYSDSAKDPQIYSHICSVLAGYAWDKQNPYTGKNAARRLRALAEICRG